MIQIHFHQPLTHDAQIVQIGLDAAVGTAAHTDLELMRELHLTVALVEPVMDLFGQAEGIDKAVLAGGTLAGNHGAHLGTGTAGLQPFPGNIGTEILDLVKGDTLNLHGHPGGEGDIAVAELFCRLADALKLLRGDLTVDGNDPGGEIVGSLVAQKAKTLDSLFVFRADG